MCFCCVSRCSWMNQFNSVLWGLFFLSLKPLEDSHVKPGAPRHKQYGTPTRPSTPRSSKHRLSVDANLQIPEVLNSASKKDLLRRVRAPRPVLRFPLLLHPSSAEGKKLLQLEGHRDRASPSRSKRCLTVSLAL